MAPEAKPRQSSNKVYFRLEDVGLFIPSPYVLERSFFLPAPLQLLGEWMASFSTTRKRRRGERKHLPLVFASDGAAWKPHSVHDSFIALSHSRLQYIWSFYETARCPAVWIKKENTPFYWWQRLAVQTAWNNTIEWRNRSRERQHEVTNLRSFARNGSSLCNDRGWVTCCTWNWWSLRVILHFSVCGCIYHCSVLLIT